MMPAAARYLAKGEGHVNDESDGAVKPALRQAPN